ncbi:MAG: trigger factor [Bdellovibrio sp.]|nr:MAG: trigger factor [Bdellovibrio sp.]
MTNGANQEKKMKAEITDQKGLQRTIQIDVPTDYIKKTMDNTFKEIQKDVEVKGFRKGKAPLDIIKTKYKDYALKEARQDIISAGIDYAIKELDLKVFGPPSIHGKLEELSENTPYTFSFQTDIEPEIELKKYKGLKVSKPSVTVTDQEVEESLKSIQKSRMELTPVLEDRGAQEEDFVTIDFEGFVDGEKLQNGSAQGYRLQIGSKTFIPGFEEGLIGAKVGEERTLNLSFPEDYSPELAGKPVSFKVKIQKLEKPSYPPIDDKLAQDFLKDESKTLNDLKEQFKDFLTRQKEDQAKEVLKENVLNALVKENFVSDIPESLYKQQYQQILHNVHRELSQQGYPQNAIVEYEEKWREDLKKTAENLSKVFLLLEKIAEKENIQVEEKDLSLHLMKEAYAKQTQPDKILEEYKKNDSLNLLLRYLREEKTIQFLIDNAEITEEEKQKEQ